jgi:predicted aspartyl protease
MALLLGAAINLGAVDVIPVGTPPASAATPPTLDSDQLTEIIIEAPEPRYVAPTRRDRIGRIWAPVYINGKGPFRMVLDTGASRSGVTAGVVALLGMTPDESAPVKLQGATGSSVVPTIRVDTLLVGDVLISGSKLPILRDALGGAEGILGNEGLADRRVYIDFLRDLITITRSHEQRAGAGFMTIPFSLEHGRLLVAQVRLGNVRAKAIIDTGSQSTVGNLALRNALVSRHSREQPTVDELQGVTADIQEGEGHSAPPIEFGPIEIHTRRMTFADAHIFQYWRMTNEPALLIGMDALGTLDTLIIDYRRHELQLRMREGS